MQTKHLSRQMTSDDIIFAYSSLFRKQSLKRLESSSLLPWEMQRYRPCLFTKNSQKAGNDFEHVRTECD